MNDILKLIGKRVSIERAVLGSQKPYYYEGIVLEINELGIWINDRKEGRIFLPFSQITVKEAKDR